MKTIEVDKIIDAKNKAILTFAQEALKHQSILIALGKSWDVFDTELGLDD